MWHVRRLGYGMYKLVNLMIGSGYGRRTSSFCPSWRYGLPRQLMPDFPFLYMNRRMLSDCRFRVAHHERRAERRTRQ